MKEKHDEWSLIFIEKCFPKSWRECSVSSQTRPCRTLASYRRHYRVLLSTKQHVILPPQTLLQFARPLVDTQVRDKRYFKLSENRVSTGDARLPMIEIQKLVEHVIPEIHCPISVKCQEGNGTKVVSSQAKSGIEFNRSFSLLLQ